MTRDQLRARLAEGPVRRHLVRLTVPMVWGILAMMAFNATDTWFVAQLGASQLAAMSFTFPVIMVLISLGIGLMAGTSSVLARAIGRGDQEQARRLATDASLLGLLVSLALTALGLATMDPLFRLLGVAGHIRPFVNQYMTVWYAGFLCFLVPMVGMGAIRASGEMRLQGALMIGSAVLNLILDPLLIFGWLGFPRLGIEGAALATVIARAASLAVGFWFIHFRFHMLSFALPRPAELWASWRSVLHVGLPAAGTNVIIPASLAVIVAMIAPFGAEAVAGFGVATRIEALTLVVFYAMSATIGPFVGQNLGAGRCERILEALRESALFCLAFGALVALALGLAAEALVRLFNDQPEVVAVGAAYLTIVPVSYGTAGIIMVANAAFNGLGQPLPAVAISVVRMGVLYLPLAWLGSRLFAIRGIFAAACLANLLVGIGAYFWNRHTCRRRLAAQGRAALEHPS